MEKITFKDFKNGKGFFDIYLRDEDIKLLTDDGIKDDDILINFAYTDYGGDFFDRVAIEFFSDKKYSNCFHSHNTVYYGKNGILWGNIARDFLEASERHPLGYENIEDFYFQKEREAQEKQAHEFLNDYKDDNGEELNEKQKNYALGTICEELQNHSILSSGTIDICEDTLIKTLQEFLQGDYKIILSEEREKIADNQYFGKIE